MAVASRTWTASYGRYVQLRITAQEVEVDVPNNRSKVRVTGQIYYPGGTRATNGYPQTYTVTVDGTQIGRQTSITYNLASGGTRNLTTYTSGWINHNSNGSKSVTVRGHITDGAGDTGTISQSYALTTIARASTLNSFSMPNHLKPSTTTSFSLGISRKSTSFTHDIQLRDGTTVIASWTGQGTPTALSLTPTQTNTLLRRMSSSTSRSMTLRVQTKSGSSNIGGALTRTSTAYVHSTVRPTVSGLSVAIEGNAHAKNNVKRFVQNISRVYGSFTRSATGGASISSSKLEIRRTSGGSDLQTINSNSGTFSRAVALSGQYQARGTATDSRGRSSNTGWLDLSNFNVLAYSAPQITNFKTTRRTATPTTVDIVRYGKHSGLSGGNVLTIRLQKRASGTTSWTNVVPNASTSNNSFGSTIPSTGHSVASSYDFRLYIVDQFGNSAQQISTVSTQRVVLDIHKNEGVGIGKIHERGVLDVDGGAYFTGDVNIIDVDTGNYGSIYINPPPTDNAYRGLYFRDSNPLAQGDLQFRIAQYTDNGVPRELYVGEFDNAPNSIQFFKGESVPRIGGNPIIDQGMNGNGYWVKYFDGTQICYKNESTVVLSPTSDMGDTGIRFVNRVLTFAKSFVGRPAISTTNVRETQVQWTGIRNSTSTYVDVYLYGYGSFRGSVGYIAVGRWKD